MFILFGIKNKEVSVLFEGNDEDSVIETCQTKEPLAIFDTIDLANAFVLKCFPKTKKFPFKYNRKSLLAYYDDHEIKDCSTLPKNP